MSNRTYCYHIDNPLKEAIATLTESEPPDFLIGLYHTTELNDYQLVELQDWCGVHTKIHWATSESILDAADLIVGRATENANIPPGPTSHP